MWLSFFFLCLSALNLRRRPWYGHLLSCPPLLPPKWTLKCLIRVNQGALAANHSPHPVTPRPWVPKGLRVLQGEWGWRMVRAWLQGQVPKLKSKEREAPQWSHLISQRVAHPLVRKKVGTTGACSLFLLFIYFFKVGVHCEFTFIKCTLISFFSCLQSYFSMYRHNTYCIRLYRLYCDYALYCMHLMGLHVTYSRGYLYHSSQLCKCTHSS